jgi:hypothetical protein
MLSHEHFEELCALASLGEISEDELGELREHIRMCAPCQAVYEDLSEIIAKKPANPKVLQESNRELSDLFYRDGRRNKQFAARAQQEGIHLSEEARRVLGVRPAKLSWPFPAYKYAVALALLSLLVLAGFLGYRLRESNVSNALWSAETARLKSELESLRKQVGELPPSGAPPASESPVKPPALPYVKHTGAARDDSGLESELSKHRDNLTAALAQAKALEEQLQKASTEIETLKAEAATAKNSEGQFASKLQQAEQSISQLTDELQKLRNNQSEDASAKAAQEARINELSERLRSQTEALERERRLLAADRDIRDLMSARNLHIIDVYDVDSRGKTRQAFGRVFYTEGKSLIFYAFDLAGKGSANRVRSFQAWGRQESDDSTPQATKSLGVFYADDQKQNRWVLKFNDPDVLAQIDYVFVTIEPPGGSRKPSGQKLLYAYLKQKPNHP